VLGGVVVSLGFVAYARFALGAIEASVAAALAAALLGSWSLARAALAPRLAAARRRPLWWGLAATALRAPADEALLWLGLGIWARRRFPDSPWRPGVAPPRLIRRRPCRRRCS
jgi:hypothetical protein